MSRRSRPSPLLSLLVLASGLLVPGTAGSDDTALFSTSVPPNVVLVIDNSGSMNHVVWHPEFDPTETPTCTYYSNDTNYSWSGDIIGLTRCSKTINLYFDPETSPYSNRITGRYLNWLFSPESDAYNADINAQDNGTYSQCLGGGTYDKYRRTRITAAKDVLREVICNVNAAGEVRFGIAQFRVSGDPNGGYIRVPAEDYLDEDGDPHEYTLNGSNKSHGEHLEDAIEAIDANTWTPLGETLFQVYTYFMSRDSADRPVGKDGTTKFAEYEYKTSTSGVGGEHSGSGAPTVPDSPVLWACQKNFVVVITDGEPTRDDFVTVSPTNTARDFSDFKDDLIGDYHADGEDEEPGSFPGCTNCQAARYLDDIALFMQTVDFRPDLDGDQVVDVYTVGFTTSPFANDVLEKTAENGNGLFFYSNNAEELALAIVETISDIIRKSQAFTAATVPAVRTSTGGKLYNGYFIPSNADGYWEGHLRSWTFNEAGEILDKSGNCALDDPTPSQCLVGPFLPSAKPWWDAAEEVPDEPNRKLYTSALTGTPGVSQKLEFQIGNVDETHLNVTAGDLSRYPYPGTPAADESELAQMLVQNVRGCEFGTGVGGVPCTARASTFGDVFHSNPVVVPKPFFSLNEPSYKAFKDPVVNPTVGERDQVIVAGANDGFFRILHAGTWRPLDTPPNYDAGTGEELAGFAPYTARTNLKELPIDGGSRDYYFADGSPTVADVWLYDDPIRTNPPDKTKDQWHTVAVAGMREGGRQYFALNITDPASPSYPDYMWEFPREDAPASIRDVMGESWSQPVVTRVRVKVNGDDNNGLGHERFVAIFGTGYDPKSDPNEHASYDVEHLGGRALVMLDVATGEILGMKSFDASGTTDTTDPASFAYDPAAPERSMHYAFAAPPAVYDLNFDGYADVVFIGDLGGNMWKWVIHDVGIDPVNGATTDTSQPDWPFVKFFAAPVYDSGTNQYFKSFFFSPSATKKNGKLWLAFGSGERANLNFEGLVGVDLENNRFYAMTDLDPLEKFGSSTLLTEADLVDITGDASCVDVGSFRGYYFLGEDGEKFVTQSGIAFYYLFVASFVPSPSLDPCDSGGEAYFYAFKVYCGEGLFEDGAGNPVAKIDLGSGMPTDPKISVGESDTTVIVNKGDRIERPPEDLPGLEGDHGQAFWHELSQ